MRRTPSPAFTAHQEQAGPQSGWPPRDGSVPEPCNPLVPTSGVRLASNDAVPQDCLLRLGPKPRRYRSFLLQGKRKAERRPLVDVALPPNPPAMALHQALNERKTDARPLEIFRRMEPLEDAEELVHVFHQKAHAVIFDPIRNLLLVRR